MKRIEWFYIRYQYEVVDERPLYCKSLCACVCVNIWIIIYDEYIVCFFVLTRISYSVCSQFLEQVPVLEVEVVCLLFTLITAQYIIPICLMLNAWFSVFKCFTPAHVCLILNAWFCVFKRFTPTHVCLMLNAWFTVFKCFTPAHVCLMLNAWFSVFTANPCLPYVKCMVLCI